MNNMNNILADIVKLTHTIMILFIILGPFYKNPLLIILHIVSCLCLLMHWYANSDICCLTIVESKLRNVEQVDTIVYKFIQPIYNISELEFNKIIWLYTTLVVIISIYKLYKSENVYKIYKYFIDKKSVSYDDINYISKYLV